MRIYNEITTKFNDITGKWDTVSEDSFDYNGPVAMFAEGGALPANALPLSEDEKITETVKTTTGYFSNGDGTLEGTTIYTASSAASNKKYYFNLTNGNVVADSSKETQLSVTYGHIYGSGSDAQGDTSSPTGLKSETDAIYSQFASLLLPSDQQNDYGFSISAGGATITGKDESIYVLVGKRNRFKDRINKGAWTLSLSGSNSAGAGVLLSLTDDSKTASPTTTPAGNRYNIVSGSVGGVESPASVETYGWLYPEMGVMVLGGLQMSASMPGKHSGIDFVANFAQGGATILERTDTNWESCSGFHANITNTTNAQNSMRLVNCMRNMGVATTLRLRSEEDQTQINYFCRVKPKENNFSNNPTFVSGSLNKIRNTDMNGNPQVFITGIGLYNAVGQLVAVAKLSSPLKKNFASEATIKVKLTY